MGYTRSVVHTCISVAVFTHYQDGRIMWHVKNHFGQVNNTVLRIRGFQGLSASYDRRRDNIWSQVTLDGWIVRPLVCLSRKYGGISREKCYNLVSNVYVVEGLLLYPQILNLKRGLQNIHIYTYLYTYINVTHTAFECLLFRDIETLKYPGADSI